MKKVKVNYPKKRTRLHLENLADAAEPERRSVYQVLQDNLKAFNRATFIHRIIYVGEHQFESYTQAKDLFNGFVKKCNETYCLEKLSGFFLYYNKYIVHLLEGDEDNLNKHIGLVLDKDANHYRFLGTMKLLTQVSNINQRLLEDWVSYTESPSTLLEKLDINADLQTSGRFIFNCIKKIYSLVGAYVDDSSEIPNASQQVIKNTDPAPNLETHVTSSNASNSELTTDRSLNIESNQRDYKFFLPEYELLDFVINSSFTMELEDYHRLYGVVPMIAVYKDKVWPVPHDFIPYDIFEKPYECVTELPKDVRKRPTVPAASMVSAPNLPGTQASRRKSPGFQGGAKNASTP